MSSNDPLVTLLYERIAKLEVALRPFASELHNEEDIARARSLLRSTTVPTLSEVRRNAILKAAQEDGMPMPKLEDLKASLLTMSPEELRNKILQIREDRKLRKESTPARKERVRTEAGAKELLAGLSPADLAALLAEMGDG